MKENNIEEDVKYVKELLEIARVFFKAVKAETDYKNVDEIAFCNALANILAEREQKDKRIQELEEQVKMLDEAYTGTIKESKKWFDIAHNSIPTQVVIDKIKELEKLVYEIQKSETCEEYPCGEDIIYRTQIDILQELLERKK